MKIGLLFLVFMVMIQSVLYFALYWTLADDRVDEVFNRLVQQTESHAEALALDFSDMTMSHVVLMEQSTAEDVVITDGEKQILASSMDPSEALEETVVAFQLPDENQGSLMIEDNWQGEEEIASAALISVDEETAGYVFMLAPSDQIAGTIDQLTVQFVIGGLLAIALSVVTVYFLSRVISVPLRRMKTATDQLARGEMHVTLGYEGQDELGELEMAIRRLAQDLEKLKKDRNEFLAGIAHELKTPLTYVKGYADIARKPETSETDRLRYIGIIEEEAASLSRLVGELFDLAKLDSNEFTVEMDDVDLSGFLTNFCEEARGVLREKEISLVTHVEEGLWTRADLDRLTQVLRNLLDNAVRYSETDTTVTVEARRDTENRIQLSVSDEGIGMAKHHLPYVFDRLYRVDKSRSRAKGGSGIGLSIVKSIIDRHGWSIAIHSEVNQGTVLTVTMPEGRKRNGKNSDRG
ncbi:Two component system histidine kinase [Salisediminibacterium beveridgei]|uniref:histidine kinase n=1 Tax=Salisediminibacterium beveridgei TaxID=632773 RepID=A0A1D7QZ97_9BACI|nr:Two component system histidine kinase [Salisediminibacterium beveridgei]